jgi:phosphoglycolate phosphatase
MWLYLFDIDGTLVHSGGAGRRAIEVAFERVWARAIPWDGYGRLRFNGRTDLAILRDVGALVGLTEEEYLSREPALLDEYLDALPDEVERASGRLVYPGIPELLEALSVRPELRLALLTGNLERGARAKLAPFGLNRYFVVGGYGSDAVDRREIARIARTRAEEAFGIRFPAARVVVVGDTPADVDCARAGGFCAVAVGTGGETRESLDACSPDLYFDNFADTGAVLERLFHRFPPEGVTPAKSSP